MTNLTVEPAEAGEAAGEFPGLCRICGGSVPPLADPNSCTATLCSERCLAQALVDYWAARGVTVSVVLRDGYARLEGIAGGRKPR
ncbi:MAG: hypothetical protein ACE147_18945 [Candidatus Methylomirabilales bacterium]